MKSFVAGLKGLGFSRAVVLVPVVIPSSPQPRSHGEDSEESAFQNF
jgi:hypothetical protein